MSNPRPRPKVIMLTEAAAGRIKAIMAAKGTNVVGPRIGVKKGGCAGGLSRSEERRVGKECRL